MAFLFNIKEKYPEFYKTKLNNLEIKNPSSFEGLYNDE